MQQKIFFTKKDFDRVKGLKIDKIRQLQATAEMVRQNILAMVMVAGSGHLGTSLSAADVMTVLYHRIMKVWPKDIKRESRDVFVLSKGHAAPAVYSVLASLGFFPDKRLAEFRRLKGLEGHIDLATPGVEGNSGSLGMGISKGKGQALAIKKKGLKARVFVMVGDGELQEGQNWEAIQSAPTWKLGNLVLLVDQNMIQTDKLVDELLPMRPIEEKIRAFGWQVEIVDGHNISALVSLLERLNYQDAKPKAIILKTVKGRGVSFMEYPYELKQTGGFYRWHNKIPDQQEYSEAVKEIAAKIKKLLGDDASSDFFPGPPSSFPRPAIIWTEKSVVDGYTDALQELCARDKKIIVLDGDLAADCGLRPIEKKYPSQFLEAGIAEQDLVSVSAGLARRGFLPLVNTFAAFLTSRANEQIFNNETEYGKIIYVGHLAGLIPATPGKSHQAVRDIALMKTMPNLVIFEPCNYTESKTGIKYLIQKNSSSAYLRLAGVKGMVEINLPKNYQVELGKGVVLQDGKDAALISYGPIMLGEALKAAAILKSSKNIEVKVVNLPWLNKIDRQWLKANILPVKKWLVIDNHIAFGGLAEELKKTIENKKEFAGIKIHNLAVEGIACTGQVREALKCFNLDDESIVKAVKENL